MNRSIQCFLRDTYGEALWRAVSHAADLPAEGFEAMLTYDDRLTEACLDAAVAALQKPREVILEDVGTYLVSNPKTEAVRRLLRFGGTTFVDFLQSLDDLPERARLAVSDLDMPALELIDDGEDAYRLICRWRRSGFGHVMVGILRTLADDYGALVLLDHCGGRSGEEQVSIRVLHGAFTEGRSFDLAAGL